MTNRPAQSEVRRLRLYTKANILDTAQSVIRLRRNQQFKLYGGKVAETDVSSFNNPMTLQAKRHSGERRAASKKAVASLNSYKAYTLLPVTAVLTDHKLIDDKCVYKVKA